MHGFPQNYRLTKRNNMESTANVHGGLEDMFSWYYGENRVQNQGIQNDNQTQNQGIQNLTKE